MNEPFIWSSAELRRVLDEITFVNTVLDFKWRFEYEPFEICCDPDEKHPDGVRSGWLVWVTFERPDTLTGVIGRGRGRDEVIWAGASLSAVVKTAWVLFKLMVDHEAMEGFRWQGRRIFNPHNSVIDLARVQELHDERLKGVKS